MVSLGPNDWRSALLKSLAPGRCESSFRNMLSKLIVQISSKDTCYEIILCWMPQNLTIKKSQLIQVMDWCSQATNYHLSQFWPKSVLPYGITGAQWIIKRYESMISWIHVFTLYIERERDKNVVFYVIIPIDNIADSPCPIALHLHHMDHDQLKIWSWIIRYWLDMDMNSCSSTWYGWTFTLTEPGWT